ncbi:MAG: ArsR family transcriptional regulator [Candidatus Baldrarchaeia archaeon]
MKIVRKSCKFDVYDLIKITGIPRPTLIRYLRILEVAGILTSIRKRRKIYMVNKFSIKPLGSYLSKSS